MKAQTGLETLMMFSFLIIFFLIAFTLYTTRQSEVSFSGTYLEAAKVCNLVKNKIDAMFSSGLGSFAVFELENKLEGSNYEIFVNGNEKAVSIRWSNNSVSCELATSSVSNKTSSSFFVNAGKNSAKNIDGVVIIEKI